jgi:hypothetical protein
MRHWRFSSGSGSMSFLLAITLGACGSDPVAGPIARGEQPRFDISHAGTMGNAHFFFLPPIVGAQTATNGVADGTLAPEVTVCDLGTAFPTAMTPCDPTAQPSVVARFTISEGTGGQLIRYEGNAQHYMVNWDTGESAGGGLKPDHYYRIHVRVGALSLGHADIDPVASGSDLRNVTTGQVIPLLNGRTLPVKFRIEQGALEYDATTYDAARDFSSTNNPNGTWRSGWTATLGSPLVLYAVAVPDNGFIRWLDQSINSLDTPNYAKNASATDRFGSTPGQVSLHPGCHAGEFAVLRWTAPATGAYLVRAQFYDGDGAGTSIGETTAHILRDSDVSAPLLDAAKTSITPSFSQTLSLTAGEALDFVVGTSADGCFFDTTPLTVAITPLS